MLDVAFQEKSNNYKYYKNSKAKVTKILKMKIEKKSFNNAYRRQKFCMIVCK